MKDERPAQPAPVKHSLQHAGALDTLEGLDLLSVIQCKKVAHRDCDAHGTVEALANPRELSEQSFGSALYYEIAQLHAMPLQAPETYELDHSDKPLMNRHSVDDDSDFSDVDEFDPLKGDEQAYTDGVQQTKRSLFDSEKNGSFSKQPLAWLDTQSKRGGFQRWLIPSRFCCILILLFVTTLVLLLSVGGLWVYKGAVPDDGQSEPWYPSPKGGTLESWKDSFHKAKDLVGQMSLVEKVNITTGIGWSMGLCVGNTGPVDRLGFPSLCLQDGPLGLRFADNATAWPAGITVGATWNKKLMYQRGKAHGFEAKKKGINVILGPSMGPFGRMPAGEYLRRDYWFLVY